MRNFDLYNSVNGHHTMNLRNLLCKQKIADMSHRAKNGRSHTTLAQRDADVRDYLNNYIVGGGKIWFKTFGDFRLIEAPETSFVFHGITTEVLFPDYPEYRFDRVKDFTLSSCRIKSLMGMPQVVLGNLTIESCQKEFPDFDKAEYLPLKVEGDVTIKACPHLKSQDFIRHSDVAGQISDSCNISDSCDDDDFPFTEGQQLILDYASDLGDDLFSADEWNDLEQFFRDQF